MNERMRLLAGRSAIIYGGSGMLGGKIARELYNEGANVAIHYFTNDSKAKSLAKSLDPTGKHAISIQADCKDYHSLVLAVNRTKETFGSVDIIINAVHSPFDAANISEADENDWTVHLDALSSAFNIFKSALPVMQEQQFGRIIYISAALAVRYAKGCSMYTTVKKGLIGFCQTLAKEEGKNNILVNVVAPGAISDAMTESGEEWDKIKEELIARCALGRFASSQEVANAVIYFASPLGNGITGQILYISGGEIMP